MISLRNVHAADLEQLLLIEEEGFSKEKAATREAMVERIHKIADTFIIAEKDGEIVGYINGPIINHPYITDDLFETIGVNPKTGGTQSILGIAVSKKVRNQGIARILIEKLGKLAAENRRQGITLTCKEELVSFYEKLGFVNHGLSDSKHGRISWYNLVKSMEDKD